MKIIVEKETQKGFIPIIIILGIILIIGVAGGIYYFGKSQVQKPQPIVSSSSSVSSLTPVYIGNYDVEVKLSPDSPCNTDTYLHSCKSDIYLKDKETGKETYILTTNDVVRNDYRYPRLKPWYFRHITKSA